MARVKQSELGDSTEAMGARVMGKTLEFGPARIHIRPLTKRDVTALAVLVRRGELARLQEFEWICRLAVTGWEIQWDDGEAVEYKREPLGWQGLEAIPADLIQQFPMELLATIASEIDAISNLSEPEKRRLDFTLPARLDRKAQ